MCERHKSYPELFLEGLGESIVKKLLKPRVTWTSVIVMGRERWMARVRSNKPVAALGINDVFEAYAWTLPEALELAYDGWVRLP